MALGIPFLPLSPSNNSSTFYYHQQSAIRHLAPREERKAVALEVGWVNSSFVVNSSVINAVDCVIKDAVDGERTSPWWKVAENRFEETKGEWDSEYCVRDDTKEEMVFVQEAISIAVTWSRESEDLIDSFLSFCSWLPSGLLGASPGAFVSLVCSLLYSRAFASSSCITPLPSVNSLTTAAIPTTSAPAPPPIQTTCAFLFYPTSPASNTLRISLQVSIKILL